MFVYCLILSCLGQGNVWCICFMRFLMVCFEMVNSLSFLMECSCMASLTLVVMVMRKLTFHLVFEVY